MADSCPTKVDFLTSDQFIQLGDEDLAYWIDGHESKMQCNLALKIYLPLKEDETIDKIMILDGKSPLETRYFPENLGQELRYILFHRLPLASVTALTILIGLKKGESYKIYAKTIARAQLQANLISSWQLTGKNLIISAGLIAKATFFSQLHLPTKNAASCTSLPDLLPKVSLTKINQTGSFEFIIDLRALPDDFKKVTRLILITDPVGQPLAYKLTTQALLANVLTLSPVNDRQFEKDFKTPRAHKALLLSCPFVRILVDCGPLGGSMSRFGLH